MLNFAEDWALWQQALVSVGVAFVWLTAINWVLKLFGKPSKDSPTQSQMDSAGAQQAQTSGADSPVAQSTEGPAVITGDNSPVTIGATQPTARVVIIPGIQGQLRGPWIIIEIENPDDYEHYFQIRLISFEGLVTDSPNVANQLPAIMCAREPIGPRQKSEIQIGQVDGGSSAPPEPYKTIYLFYPEGTGRRSQLPAHVPLGKSLTIVIEIVSDALMEQPQRSTWELKLDDSGSPLSFIRMP